MQYEALKGVRNQMARDRVLNDLGASFAQLGVFTAARDAFLVVAATAQEQYMRWTATLNLLEVAVQERRETLVEQYRRELDGASLPPTLQTYYYIYMAQGHRAFDQLPLAKAAVIRAIEVATENQLGQLRFEAEELLGEFESLERSESQKSRIVSRSLSWSPEVHGIAEAIHELRTMAGVQE